MEYIVIHYALKRRRACRLVKQTRSVQYYRSVKDPRHDLRARMRELAQVRIRYGYRRIHVLLKRDGWRLGKNQMYRLIAKSSCNCARSCRSGARWSWCDASAFDRARRMKCGVWTSSRTSSPTARGSAR